MQVQTNVNQPNFKSFLCDKRVMSYIEKHISEKQIPELKKIITEEHEKHPNIEILLELVSSDYLGAKISTGSKDNPSSYFTHNVSPQGVLSKMFKGPLGYMKSISKNVDKVINKIMKVREKEQAVFKVLEDVEVKNNNSEVKESLIRFINGRLSEKDLSLNDLIIIKDILMHK